MQQFNKGVFDLLIATDEKHKESGAGDDDDLEDDDEDKMDQDKDSKSKDNSGSSNSEEESDDSLDGEDFDLEAMQAGTNSSTIEIFASCYNSL